MDPTRYPTPMRCQWELAGSMDECGDLATVIHIEHGVDPWNNERYVVVRPFCDEHAQDARDEADSWPAAVCASYTQQPVSAQEVAGTRFET